MMGCTSQLAIRDTKFDSHSITSAQQPLIQLRNLVQVIGLVPCTVQGPFHFFVKFSPGLLLSTVPIGFASDYRLRQ